MTTTEATSPLPIDPLAPSTVGAVVFAPRFYVVSTQGFGYGAYARKVDAIHRVLGLRAFGVDALITEPSL